MKKRMNKHSVPAGIISSRKIFVFDHVIIVSRRILVRGGCRRTQCRTQKTCHSDYN
jgi:hypothetical protein